MVPKTASDTSFMASRYEKFKQLVHDGPYNTTLVQKARSDRFSGYMETETDSFRRDGDFAAYIYLDNDTLLVTGHWNMDKPETKDSVYQAIKMIVTSITSASVTADIQSDSYRFTRGDTHVSVEISGSWSDMICLVQLRAPHASFSQRLNAGRERRFINRYDWIGHQWSRPAVGVIWLKGEPIIWCLVVAAQVGVHEEAQIILWRWDGRAWTPLPGPTPIFSNRGSFFAKGDRLFVWDFDYDTNRGHWDSHHYILREFRVTGSAISQVSSKKTKRKYSPEGPGGYPVPEIVAKENDPLREFGMRWQWWGQKAPWK
ncbi:MAG: hypothetical protein ACR2HJ_05565 [Fimbriimonadales bacterium]